MWIKRLVIMLPSKNGNSKIGLNPSALFNKPHLYYFNEGAVYHECQHLYITSDEEIKEGDWIYRYEDKKVFQSKSYFSAGNPIKKGLITKIIATTDKSITINGYDSSDEDAVVNCYLPQIPQQFIEKFIEEYNKGNQIKEIMIEYETSQITKQEWFQEAPYRVKYDITALKVKSDNTITIRKIKNSWTREEVINLCRSAHLHGEQGALNIHYQTFKQWVEENL